MAEPICIASVDDGVCGQPVWFSRGGWIHSGKHLRLKHPGRESPVRPGYRCEMCKGTRLLWCSCGVARGGERAGPVCICAEGEYEHCPDCENGYVPEVSDA